MTENRALFVGCVVNRWMLYDHEVGEDPLAKNHATTVMLTIDCLYWSNGNIFSHNTRGAYFIFRKNGFVLDGFAMKAFLEKNKFPPYPEWEKFDMSNNYATAWAKANQYDWGKTGDLHSYVLLGRDVFIMDHKSFPPESFFVYHWIIQTQRRFAKKKMGYVYAGNVGGQYEETYNREVVSPSQDKYLFIAIEPIFSRIADLTRGLVVKVFENQEVDRGSRLIIR